MPQNKALGLPFLTRDMLNFQGETTLSLILQLNTTSTDTIEIRGFTKDGPFVYRATPAAVNTIEEFSFPLPDIPVSVSVLYDPSVEGTQMAYCNLHLGMNGNRIVLLAQGMVASFLGISWPYQQETTHTSINGQVVKMFMTAPGAGAEVQQAVPDGQVWEILNMNMQLSTSATVADRTVAFMFEDPNAEMLRRISGATQQASENIRYTGVPGGTTATVVANALHEIGLPAQMILPGSSIIKTVTTNLQAGDDFGTPNLTVRRWFVRN